MNRFVNIVILALFLFSCSGFDDVRSRLDHLEAEVRDLKTALFVLEQASKDGKIITTITPIESEISSGWIIVFTDGTSITILNGENGDSIIDSINLKGGIATVSLSKGTTFMFYVFDNSPKILSFEFLAEDNPLQLIDDVKCTIEGDSLVVCWIPHLVDEKVLTPHFLIVGDSLCAGELELISDETSYDFSRPVLLTVRRGGQHLTYKVLVHSFTGLPVCWIETENRAPIVSKEDYINASFRLIEDVLTKSPGEVIESRVHIRGRGNSTWFNYPKKPYRLKFGDKVSLCDEPKDKSWVLLANYLDKSMLCNYMAFYMGQMSRIEWTPHSHFVELILNGVYQGTYQLTENIKIAKHRVNVGDDGFVMEIDGYATGEEDARYFPVAHLQQVVNIKDPDVEYGDDNFNYVKRYVQKADSVLYSEGFRDQNEGWQKYMDIDTFVDYYLINEIIKNCDTMWWNAYMNLTRSGKIKMGPLWDYDNAFGTYVREDCTNPEGFWVKDKPWYNRLFEDPIFVNAVKDRFAYFYERRDEIYANMNTMANYLKYSAIENDNKWNILYNYERGNYNIWGDYYNEVTSIKSWLNARFEWLNTAMFEL